MIKHGKEIVNIVKMAFSLLFTLSVSVAIISFFYSGEIMSLLYPGDNTAAAQIFSILMFGFIAVSGIYVFSTLLTANGNLKHLNIIAASAIVFNLAVNLLLIPRLMALGSAYASLSAQGISVVLQIIVVQMIFRFRLNFPYLLSLIVFAVLMIAAAWFSRQLPLQWYFNLFILGFFALLASSSLRLLNIKGFIKLIRSREEAVPGSGKESF